MNERQTNVAVTFGDPERARGHRIDVTGQFLGSSIIAFERDSQTAMLAKSPTRHSWTIDQAVTDAAAVAREIRSAS
ncbi:hypothetical protein BPNPMPFG_002413 [Mesorhizobium sp. AR07]|uniref:hypothetical protein n=1 Tax=Mesorhizobium sp. AR07 TaxID=2865838 RepID=UPI00215E93FF|nr:hypothetical protein [Mesorhizobium sp. AR07]UVK46711.1 hypothetical protein BPNPMPFG_002413 [Mesorhizobium sp. AR07]